MNHHEIVIVGAGGMGSAAAYHLAKSGYNPLLLEQFDIGHSKGSSHGGSRITRFANPDYDECRVIPATFELWQELEQESGMHLLDLTGSLFMGFIDDPFMKDTRDALAANEFSFRNLNSAELATEFPQFNLPHEWCGLYQADAGRLAATQCVEAMVNQALAHGAVLREKCKVESFGSTGDGATLTLADGEKIVTDRLILTTGPWSKAFLDTLQLNTSDLRVTRQQVAYFPVEETALYDSSHCPVYIFTSEPNIYGFPILEKPDHVKIALENEELTTHPDQPREIMEENIRDLCAVVEQYFQGVVPQPSLVETCLYTETPNREFIIDRVPKHPQIAIAAGFSGRGFKFTIGIGRLLADLVTTDAGNYDSFFWSPKYALNNGVDEENQY